MGLTLAEAKRLLAGVEREIVAVQARARVLLSVQHGLEPGGDGAVRHDVRRLPIGLQIVGRRFDDLGVLQAAAFEAALPRAERQPPLDGTGVART